MPQAVPDQQRCMRHDEFIAVSIAESRLVSNHVNHCGHLDTIQSHQRHLKCDTLRDRTGQTIQKVKHRPRTVGLHVFHSMQTRVNYG